MTVKDLYALCDNLNQYTLFTIRSGHLEKAVDVDVRYIELAQYWDTRVKGFMIDDRRHCTIYI